MERKKLDDQCTKGKAKKTRCQKAEQKKQKKPEETVKREPNEIYGS